MKLGRNPLPSSPRMRVNLSHFLDASALPTPPATFDYTSEAMKSLRNPYLNNQLGDCVIAGGYHIRDVLSANAGVILTATDQEIIHDYSKIGGYNGRPSSDNGANEQDALHYWQTVGFTNGDKIEGWLAVDPGNVDLCAKICYVFEHLYYGTGLPDSWLNVSDGFKWDVSRNNANNGHCFAAFGHSPKGFKISTWGMLGTLTDAANASNIDECYVMLDDTIISKVSQKAPNAIDWSGLVKYWNSIGGTLPEPPAPIQIPWMDL